MNCKNYNPYTKECEINVNWVCHKNCRKYIK